MNSISRIQQVLKAVPRRTFAQAVADHQGDRHVKKFTCWDQLVAMLYVQLAGADSLRQLEAGFNPQVNHHYHLATGCVRRTTLSDANKKRSPLIFAQLLEALIAQAGRSARAQREELLYLLDATTVGLPGRCKELRGHASAHGNHGIKLHLLLDANNAAVAGASITPANINDVTEGQKIQIEPGATYVFDKGYCNYNWWHRMDQKGARWVTRWRRDAALKVVSERAVNADQTEILRDTIVAFALPIPRGGHRNSYSGAQLRRIEVSRPGDAPLVLATNDLVSAPEEIALLYKRRWQIELFFKWVKQHLQIGRFLGANENAVRIQLLTALIAYMLVLLLKNATQFKGSLWMLLAELRGCLFQRPKTEQSYWRRRQAAQARIAAIQPGLFV
jgi:putative transposase